MNIKKQITRGFTLIELMIVIVVIGILTVITMFAYFSIEAKVYDTSVASDLDHLASLESSYRISHGTSGKIYYSGSGFDEDLNFTPQKGNILDVVTNSSDYCIRGYNLQGTKNSINNSLIRESTPGVCALLSASVAAIGTPDAPSEPVISVVLSGSSVQASITPLVCNSGSPQYGIRSRIDAGSWTSYSAWSSTLASSQTSNEGVTYAYQAQARCYASDTAYSPTTEGLAAAVTKPVNPPTMPVISLAINGSNIQATITNASTCTAGSAQYGFNNRLNDGSWAGYTDWDVATSASQSANEGVKYGYMLQARCYINDDVYSVNTTTTEGTFIQPITTIPATPTVSQSTTTYSTTTYSWGAASCPATTTVGYLYDFTTTYGYDSGWTATTSTSIGFTTSTFGYTYTMQVKSRCTSSFSTGSWSGIGSASYSRPVPTVQVLVVAGGGGGGYDNGGGGGGGGVVYSSAVTVSNTGYGVTVGGGGGPQANGGNSAAFGYTAYGGGRGGNVSTVGSTGGSGGGGGGKGSGDTGTSGSSQPGGYANIGGAGGNRNGSSCGDSGTYYAGGGGGGAGGRGGDAWSGGGGPGQMLGGNGFASSINGTTYYYSAGGGGGGDDCYWGAGGTTGGGRGVPGSGATGYNATFYGSGGGGGSGSHGQGGYGYQGIVIIRYNTAALGAGGGSISTNGSDTINTFTGSGTFQVY